MNRICNFYALGLVIIFIWQKSIDNPTPLLYVWWVFFVSLLVALIPFAMSKYWFGLPIFILLWCFFMPTAFVPDCLMDYDSNFAWLCILYAPYHYLAFGANIINGIKTIFDIN
jgi:hypothetical protein